MIHAAALLGSAALCSGALLAAPLSAANIDRLRVCGGASLKPLYYNSHLSDAAHRLANGATLQNALAGSGYRATQSTLLHLSGVGNDQEIQRLLAANYCSTLRNPKLQDFGVERRGRDVWMVLAAPLVVPAARDAASIAQAILEGVNAARAGGRRCGSKYFSPAPPLSLDEALTRAALSHSKDMAVHDAFDHRGTDGSSPAQRVERAGYGVHRIVGENIAAGAMNAREVTEGWLASPPHCENIMDPRFAQIGIAFFENNRTQAAVYWTQDFAAHR